MCFQGSIVTKTTSKKAGSKSAAALLKSLLKKEGHGHLFAKGWYPHQLKEPVDDADFKKYGGEARGFYPKYGDTDLSLGTFYPWNSFVNHEHFTKKNPRQPDEGRTHYGLDIYAPYFPFPFEVPIYALAPGTLQQQTYWSDLTWSKKKKKREPQALGNRISQTVQLDPKSKRKNTIISYGHLARFAGDDFDPIDRPQRRKVAAGELIGFAGKSGNTDDFGESSTRVSPFKVNAGHVHLSLRGALASTSLLSILPRPIAFHPDQTLLQSGKTKKEKIKREKTIRIKASEWGTTRPALRETMPQPRIAPALIELVERLPVVRGPVEGYGKALRRARYPAPFQLIDTDSTAKLKITQKAYAQMEARLTEADGAYLAKAEARWLKHLVTITKDPETVLDVTRWNETAQALALRAVHRVGQIKTQSNDGSIIPAQGAHAIIAMMHLLEAQYILMGGVAIEALNSDKFTNVQNGSTVPKEDRVRQPMCGIGVYGVLHALSYEHAVAALHATLVGEVPVWSVTFGAGSMRHATIGNSIFGLMPAGDPLRSHVSAMINLNRRIERVFAHVANSRTWIAWGNEVHKLVLEREISKIATAQVALSRTLHGLTPAQRTNLLRWIGASNAALFATAVTISQTAETATNRVVSALFTGLRAQPRETGGTDDDVHHS